MRHNGPRQEDGRKPSVEGQARRTGQPSLGTRWGPPGHATTRERPPRGDPPPEPSPAAAGAHVLEVGVEGVRAPPEVGVVGDVEHWHLPQPPGVPHLRGRAPPGRRAAAGERSGAPSHGRTVWDGMGLGSNKIGEGTPENVQSQTKNFASSLCDSSEQGSEGSTGGPRQEVVGLQPVELQVPLLRHLLRLHRSVPLPVAAGGGRGACRTLH